MTFKRPFILPELEGPGPAGTYRLVTDEEEEISVLSFLAFRRIGTVLRLLSLATSGSRNRRFSIGADEGQYRSRSAITANDRPPIEGGTQGSE